MRKKVKILKGKKYNSEKKIVIMMQTNQTFTRKYGIFFIL